MLLAAAATVFTAAVAQAVTAALAAADTLVAHIGVTASTKAALVRVNA